METMNERSCYLQISGAGKGFFFFIIFKLGITVYLGVVCRISYQVNDLDIGEPFLSVRSFRFPPPPYSGVYWQHDWSRPCLSSLVYSPVYLPVTSDHLRQSVVWLCSDVIVASTPVKSQTIHPLVVVCSNVFRCQLSSQLISPLPYTFSQSDKRSEVVCVRMVLACVHFFVRGNVERSRSCQSRQQGPCLKSHTCESSRAIAERAENSPSSLPVTPSCRRQARV